MTLKMNLLENQKDIDEYRKWLSTKSTHYLRGILAIFKRDMSMGKTKFANLSLRIELVNEEIKRRIHR